MFCFLIDTVSSNELWLQSWTNITLRPSQPEIYICEIFCKSYNSVTLRLSQTDITSWEIFCNSEFPSSQNPTGPAGFLFLLSEHWFHTYSVSFLIHVLFLYFNIPSHQFIFYGFLVDTVSLNELCQQSYTSVILRPSQVDITIWEIFARVNPHFHKVPLVLLVFCFFCMNSGPIKQNSKISKLQKLFFFVLTIRFSLYP